MFHLVLIAGMGSLGSEIAKNLGLLGCDRVYIADADLIEDINIARSVLFREGAVPGQGKTSHALDQLRRWFPKTQWHGSLTEIADVDSEVFANADVLFSCVDTDLARTEIAALSARYLLPVCDAGLGGTSTRVGRVSWFPGSREAACFSCLLTSKRRASLLSMWESNIHACWAHGKVNEHQWTSTPTMASIVAGLQIETSLSSLAKRVSNSFSLQLDLDQAGGLQTILHRYVEECPFHERHASIHLPHVHCSRMQPMLQAIFAESPYRMAASLGLLSLMRK